MIRPAAKMNLLQLMNNFVTSFNRYLAYSDMVLNLFTLIHNRQVANLHGATVRNIQTCTRHDVLKGANPIIFTKIHNFLHIVLNHHIPEAVKSLLLRPHAGNK